MITSSKTSPAFMTLVTNLMTAIINHPIKHMLAGAHSKNLPTTSCDDFIEVIMTATGVIL